ncbi:MAG: NADH-quinone oxidoreductase subunit N, partial [Bdellovibrionales bacterium]|nr:NADH-quinone oxidoreductase subunit N [Bdellovibrionales bacterium]
MGSLEHDLWTILPLLILAAGALLIMLLDVFTKEEWPGGLVAGTFLVIALFSTINDFPSSGASVSVFSGLLSFDLFTSFFFLLILSASVLVLLLSEGKLREEGVTAPGDYYALYLMCIIGAVIFVAATELITLFVGLEIMSMALYCLCGSARQLKRSAESSMKYFFLGSFSSAFLLYGIALLYGLTGTTEISHIAGALTTVDSPILSIALGLLLVGFVFKVGVFPFHFWAPDVYQGAPTPVTVFMACVIKAAAVGAMMRVLWTTFPTEEFFAVWSGAVWIIALTTMVFGNIVALRQRTMKRMLAYSSVAHAGYIMVGFLAPSEFGGGAAILFYLVSYTVMTLGAFGVVLAVSANQSDDEAGDDITRFNGLGRKSPYLAGLMTLFLLSLAGLPPGLAGFLGKFYIFSAAVRADFVGLSIVGLLCSAISCYYYLRVVVAMYFVPESVEDSSVETPRMGVGAFGVLTLCGVLVVGLGLFPAPL